MIRKGLSVAQSSTPTHHQSSVGILSPMLAALNRAFAEKPGESNAQVTSFWSEVQQTGTPLIEPTDRDGQLLVTWLYREQDRPIEAIALVEPFSWKPQEQRMLTRLGSSDIWYISWFVRDDLRGSYSFNIKWADANKPEPQEDPLAANLESETWDTNGAPTSILVMPNAAPLPWRHAGESVHRGTLHRHTWRSEILNNQRTIVVHTPAGYQTSEGPFPFIVIFDGEEPGYPGPEVIDNLIAAGKIPPLVAILVDQIEIRDKELPGNPDFSRAIATELVPMMREEYNLSHDPKDAVLNGGSYGGFCAGYTALHHSDVFGNAIMHSPSAWQHPNVFAQWKAEPNSAEAYPVGQPADVPVLIEEFRNADRKPIRLWHEVGTVENGPPPARIWQTFGNRWLHDILVLKGYDTVYREYVGGHDHAWWRGTLAEGLIWVFQIE